MAPRRDRELASSLFPFLSVLACVIGTLTLLIAALAMNQVAAGLQQPLPDEAESPTLATQRAEVRALERTLERARSLEAERATLHASLQTLGIDPNHDPRDVANHLSARSSLARLERERSALESESRKLDDALVGMTRVVEQDVRRDDDRTIRIHPLGRGEALRPFFVECRPGGVRVFYEGLEDSLFLDRNSPRGESQFEVFLRRARSLRNHTVIFLIRPDGVQTYNWALEQIGSLSLRHAKLPLPGQGELEFAL